MPYLMPQGPTPVVSNPALHAQQAVTSKNPTDYVSPQSAIAAGLDPTTVNTSWARALAQYPTQQDAIAAGIAPTAVTQYWQASRAYVAAPTRRSLLTPKNLLFFGIGGIVYGLLSEHEKGRP